MTQTNTATVETVTTLTGKYFHTQVDRDCGCRCVCWQGTVLRKVGTDTYLVQLYDWIMGDPSTQILLTLSDFMSQNAVFYDSAREMTSAYDHQNGVRAVCRHERDSAL